MFGLHKTYLFLAILFFLTEVLIAAFVHDSIVRPYIGDFLVVMLIYCFAKAFWKAPVYVVAICVLLFSYAVEWSQYFHLVDLLGLQNSSLARTIMGTSFAWIDMLAYTLGVLAILLAEKFIRKKSNKEKLFEKPL